MAQLPDQMPLSHLSIPGTHDSGAFVFGGDSVETQSMSVAEQLRAGIRVWDIRLGSNFVCDDDTLWVFHGFVCQFITFEEGILDVAQAFLSDHPGETILMRIKHEEGPTEGFADRVQAALDKYPDLIYTGDSDNPTLGEVRGKIVILRNYSGSDIGIDWNSLNIQDNYQADTNWDLANKWFDVRKQFDAADSGSLDTIYVNFLSGAGGVFPYFLASGHSSPQTDAPRLLTGWTRGVIDTCSLDSRCIDEFPSVNCALGTCSVAFEGINILAHDYIINNVNRRTGIVMADFPGAGLISAIINLNPWNVPPEADAGGPYVGYEASPITFDASGSIDDDGNPLQFRWDFDNDGDWDTDWSSSPIATHTWPDDYTGTVRLEVSDGYFSNSATTTVTVNNLDPVILEASSNGPVMTGSVATITVDAIDPAGPDYDPLTYWFDCDNAGGFEIGPQEANTAECDFGIQEGAFMVNVQVNDDDGGSATESVIVEIPTFFCVNRASGATRYVDLPDHCNRYETPITLSESNPVTVCASLTTGVVGVAMSGKCTRYDVATTLPAEGPLAVCVNRVGGQMHQSASSTTCPRATFLRLIGTPLP